jgi:hypothetical protein
MVKKNNSIIPEERIINKIVLLRGEKVILDVHLAELYGVETRALKQAVRRNRNRFPADFMYELEELEIELVVSQNVIPHKKFFGGAKPYAFTETGVAMLSSVLKSERAVEMNIVIMRTFVTLRKIAMSHDEIMSRLKQMKLEYDEKFEDIFTALDYLFNPPQPHTEERKRIGFKADE